MADIIQVLPDSVANQIAAGEVIQRPASVIKELMENAIDAGSTSVKVYIKDAGRTLIQVVDNGSGMSETDARMSFERHATSKIRKAEDLFAIRTMGFRGEALASIASVAEVELRTRRKTDELGTFIQINGSALIKQEPVECAGGTNFQVKNLFYNIPARRKFLKSNSTELRHIIDEFQRVALANSNIECALFHNNSPIYELPSENLKKRIIGLISKGQKAHLIPVDTETSLVKIRGFVGDPHDARKTMGEQFFFVNNRYMRHPFFHKAVMHAYEKVLPPDSFPLYILFFEVNPETIDINIHPTKTEIKFENEQSIWQIIGAALRESLGKFNVVPSIDFNQQGSIEIPLPPRPGTIIDPPKIVVDPDYNPFEQEHSSSSSYQSPWKRDEIVPQWEKLYSSSNDKGSDPFFSGEERIQQTELLSSEVTHAGSLYLQLKNRYVLTPVKSGLMVIDQKRAHERILYERFLNVIKERAFTGQQLLYPQTIQLEAADANLLNDILPDLHYMGFDIRLFGPNSFLIAGVPAEVEIGDCRPFIESLLEDLKSKAIDIKGKVREDLALEIAGFSVIDCGKSLSQEEMRGLVDNLFACSSPKFSPSGKPVVFIISIEEFEKRLK